MKKLILTAALIFVSIPTFVFAWEAYVSSYTATVDTTLNLCGNDAGIVRNRRGFFHGVCISSAPVSGVVSVFNSSGTTINPIAVIDTTQSGCYYYDVVASTINKGLTYSKTGTANVTFLYQCY